MSADIHTLAGAYALDAVDDIERAAFDRHLAGCASCSQELAEFRATVSRLTDPTATTPPAGLKQAVMTEVGRTRQLPPGGRGSDRVPHRSWRTWAAGVAAAAVVAVAGGAVGYALSNRNTRAEHRKAVTAASTEAGVSRVLGARDATVHVQTMAGGATVSVVVSPSLNQGVAILNDMPKVATTRSYQLWLIHGTNPVSAGVMVGGGTGGTILLTNVRGAGAFGVSLERAGGAATPSQPLVTSFAI